MMMRWYFWSRTSLLEMVVLPEPWWPVRERMRKSVVSYMGVK